MTLEDHGPRRSDISRHLHHARVLIGENTRAAILALFAEVAKARRERDAEWNHAISAAIAVVETYPDQALPNLKALLRASPSGYAAPGA